MPELPEVETVVRALREPLIGRTFLTAHIHWPRQIVQPTPHEFKQRIANTTIEAINRRAKYIVFTLSNDETLIVHLKMTGHLAVVPSSTLADKHVHLVFELVDVPGREPDQLRFRDIRKFGRVYLVKQPETVLGKLGPEPLEDSFTVAILKERFAGRKRVIKPLLLDQHIIAGIGNIYADEALFDAKIHPQRYSHTLTEQEITDLHQAIRKVLRKGIEREGASIDNYIKPDGTKGDMQNAVMVFRRTEHPCYDCGTPITRIVLGGRSTHFCQNCQH